MPDHVHMIFTPLVDMEAAEVYSLAKITNPIKGVSAHKINRALGRTGHVWQAESFDHVIRSSENLDQKMRFVIDNPVRRKLVADSSDYPWLWHRPFANPYASALRPRGDSRPRLSGRAELASVCPSGQLVGFLQAHS